MFHVPNANRMQDGPLASDFTDGNNGAFIIDSCEPGWTLVLIASDGEGEGWEHVSVRAQRSAKHSRVPTWREMVYVKERFWDDEDVVMQLHPRRSEYINNHPHVLHLWRPTAATIPTPPSLLVGLLIPAGEVTR